MIRMIKRWWLAKQYADTNAHIEWLHRQIHQYEYDIHYLQMQRIKIQAAQHQNEFPSRTAHRHGVRSNGLS